MRNNAFSRIAVAALLALSGCGGGGSGDGGGGFVLDDGDRNVGQAGSNPDPSSVDDFTPDFLLQRWMWPIAPNSIRVYDFAAPSVGGVRGVNIRAWTQIGGLGWQSQQFPGTFTANDQELVITGFTGSRENYQIVEWTPEYMIVRDQASLQELLWHNCASLQWPVQVKTAECGFG